MLSMQEGLLIIKSRDFYGVETDDGRLVVCTPSSRLRKQFDVTTADPSSRARRVQSVKEVKGVDPLAVGDRVRFLETGEGSGVIREVLPRTTKLSRRTAGKRPLEQVFAANIEAVITVHALAQPEPNWNRIDRYLASAEAADLPVALVMTKADLGPFPEEVEQELMLYASLGYPVFRTSVVDGSGMEALRDFIGQRRVAMAGSSGVGKTSLVKSLVPARTDRVRAVSERTGKGVHTTRHVEMVTLPGGGRLVDTPGMREFALWKIQPDATAELFPELRPLQGHCRFGVQCGHLSEPGCAFKTAVADGRVSRRRFENFLKIREEFRMF